MQHRMLNRQYCKSINCWTVVDDQIPQDGVIDRRDARLHWYVKHASVGGRSAKCGVARRRSAWPRHRYIDHRAGRDRRWTGTALTVPGQTRLAGCRNGNRQRDDDDVDVDEDEGHCGGGCGWDIDADALAEKDSMTRKIWIILSQFPMVNVFPPRIQGTRSHSQQVAFVK